MPKLRVSADSFGMTGIILFAIGSLQFPALASASLFLLLLGMLFWYPQESKKLLYLPPVIILAVFFIFSMIGVAMYWPTTHRIADINATIRLFGLWWFIPLAWWIGTNEKRALICLAIAAAAFIIERFIVTDWTTPLAILSGERIRLGFSSINHFAQYSATVFIGLLCFIPRIWQLICKWHKPQRALFFSGYLFLMLVSFYWLIASQSRGAWLAFGITVLMIFCAFVIRYGKHILRWGLMLSGVCLLSIYLTIGDFIIQRFSLDAETLVSIQNSTSQQLPNNSTGIRLKMLYAGWTWWKQAPFFGHGPSAVSGLIANEPGILSQQQYKHLHNIFADTLVRVGLIGALLLQSLFLWVFITAWRSYQQLQVQFDLWLFTTAALILSFLCNLTDLRLFGWDWHNYWILLAAIATAPTLSTVCQQPKPVCQLEMNS